jgi:hypothetical protein
MDAENAVPTQDKSVPPSHPGHGSAESADADSDADAEMSGGFAPDYFDPCFVCQIDGDTGELVINPSTYSSWVVGGACHSAAQHTFGIDLTSSDTALSTRLVMPLSSSHAALPSAGVMQRLATRWVVPYRNYRAGLARHRSCVMHAWLASTRSLPAVHSHVRMCTYSLASLQSTHSRRRMASTTLTRPSRRPSR